MGDLKEDELLGLLNDCVYDGKLKFGQYARGFDQIKEMIQKSVVTEEWIEEKAERFVLKCPGIIGWHSESVKKFAKDFIRSLVEEIHGRKKDKL